MPGTPVKPFNHPHGAYHLEHPAHWDQVVQKDGESCGFGPHERDDVGLWISILPFSVDTDRLAEELPRMMAQSLQGTEAKNLRRDPALHHYGMIADMTKEGEGGHYWIVAGGDLVLFASSQVPIAERDDWNPPFAALMASLRITRDKELLFRKVACDVMAELKERHPDQEFEIKEDNKIHGPGQVIYLGNLFREVREAPAKREQIVKRFVSALSRPEAKEFGYETWEGVQGSIVPVLKPRNYLVPGTATEHIQTAEWLADVLICYVIKTKKMFRFVTGWDVNRWETTPEVLHELALANLAKLPWPREMMGSRDPRGGRLVIVDTDDSLASSRLLHPDLHRLFSPGLGNPFWAGIPDRNTLVLFSDRRELKSRIGRKLKKDHDASAYPITPRPFLVTRDGIAAPAVK